MEALGFCNYSAWRAEDFILEASSVPPHFCCLFLRRNLTPSLRLSSQFLLSQLLRAEITVAGRQARPPFYFKIFLKHCLILVVSRHTAKHSFCLYLKWECHPVRSEFEFIGTLSQIPNHTGSRCDLRGSWAQMAILTSVTNPTPVEMPLLAPSPASFFWSCPTPKFGRTSQSSDIISWELEIWFSQGPHFPYPEKWALHCWTL